MTSDLQLLLIGAGALLVGCLLAYLVWRLDQSIDADGGYERGAADQEAIRNDQARRHRLRRRSAQGPVTRQELRRYSSNIARELSDIAADVRQGVKRRKRVLGQRNDSRSWRHIRRIEELTNRIPSLVEELGRQSAQLSSAIPVAGATSNDAGSGELNDLDERRAMKEVEPPRH